LPRSRRHLLDDDQLRTPAKEERGNRVSVDVLHLRSRQVYDRHVEIVYEITIVAETDQGACLSGVDAYNVASAGQRVASFTFTFGGSHPLDFASSTQRSPSAFSFSPTTILVCFPCHDLFFLSILPCMFLNSRCTTSSA